MINYRISQRILSAVEHVMDMVSQNFSLPFMSGRQSDVVKNRLILNSFLLDVIVETAGSIPNVLVLLMKQAGKW
eukprot:CAMPEP_0205812258 /NCGR_PEP_ID=MMETSP0205-20121125/16667_1 /ASSEMBLY_ACC=CAM_ASM_000278 /TAXON_ID=36767 /ORGANISM="Euplotes focardii, Strain TN1" /LENGTH=73 /DNA_ID=CAMNT_0053092667 /DNA_START=288 /DNA_END=506 /DNA_ORIENTATION=-